MIKNIAILAGGHSSEEVISLKSASVVKKHLDTSMYNATIVKITPEEWVTEHGYSIDKNDFSYLNEHKEKVTFDGVFMAIHGTPGEDGKLQAYFDLIGIPYNTCNQLAAALTFNKWTCTTLLKQIGFNAAGSVVIRNSDGYNLNEILKTVGIPCFVKPNNGGSSFGISLVKEEGKLEQAIKHALNEDDEVIIESFMEGREVTCGVYRLNGETKALPATEIVSDNEFFDYEAKYEGQSNEITPAPIPEDLYAEIQKTTIKIYDALNLNGICRIDYILKNDIPHVIEVNTVPGLSEESIIPQQIKAAGYSLQDFFSMILQEMFNE